MKTYLGVDVGTTGVKASFFDREGNLRAQSYVPSKLYYPASGLVEQKPDEMLAETVKAIQQAVHQLGGEDVVAMAIDGQMAGLMAIDYNWKPTTHYDSWLDTRCKNQIAEMNRHKAEVIHQSGATPGFFFGPKLLWWKEQKPDVYEKTAKFIEPSAYIAGKFAGLNADSAFIDYTYLHFTNLANNRNKAWSTEICSLFDVDSDKLPRIISPTEIIGTLSEDYAKKMDLNPGLPIAAGCGDTAAGLLGAALVVPAESVDTAGTASVLTFCSTDFRPDIEREAMLSCRSVIDGLWYSLAYINGGGLCIEWFAEEFGISSSDKKTAFEELNARASEVVVGSEGLIFCPHYAGRNFPYEPNLRGSWVGLNWKHKREHLYRSILEGLAFEYRHYLNNFRRLYPEMEIKRIKIIGGGSKSPLFCRIKADCTGVPYAILSEREFGTLGSALIAAAAVGDVENLTETVLEINKEFEIVKPDKKHAKQYSEYFMNYEETIDGLIDIFNKRKVITGS
jgi:xylulokinase